MSGGVTIHASAVLVGRRALLIRGPSGSGKSRLALGLIMAAESGLLRFARLIGDDRVQLEAMHGRLLVRAAEPLAGLIEVRGLGLRRLSYEAVAVVGGVVDLAAADAARLPQASSTAIALAGVTVQRLAVAAGDDPVSQVVAFTTTVAVDPPNHVEAIEQRATSSQRGFE